MEKKYFLGELVNIDSGFAFKSALFTDDDKYIPIIRIRDVNSGEASTYYSGEYDEKYIVNKGDLLISMDGSFVVKKWNSKKALLNQRVCRIKSISDKITDEYLYRILPRELKAIEDKTPFVTVKHLSIKSIENIEIKLPSLEKQKKIVEVLDKAQSLIDKKKEQIDLLDELVKSRFVDMFGDPILNPKEWKTEKLGNISKISRGGSPRPIEKFLGGTVPWIKIGDATAGDDIYIYDTKEKIIEEGVKKSRLIKKGGLIFANCGVSLGFARILKIDGCIHDGWLAFEDFEENLDKIFFLKSLNYCTEYFRKTAPDGTQPNLNTTIMKEYVQILPPMEKQKEFSNFIEKIDEIKSKMESSLSELEDNFNSLMQKAFKGELF